MNIPSSTSIKKKGNTSPNASTIPIGKSSAFFMTPARIVIATRPKMKVPTIAATSISGLTSGES
jgi:hypothetical protein